MVDGDLVAFTKRAKEIIDMVERGNRARKLDFLNTAEQEAIAGMMPKYEHVNLIFNGGYDDAERRRAALIPVFMDADQIDLPVTVYQIEVISGAEISHSQVLGSLMGLDIDRSIIGDILVDKNGAFVVTCGEFDQFFTEYFTRVGKHEIQLVPVKEPVVSSQKYEDLEIIVSSMRLDVIVKALIQGARRTAEDYLKDGYVRLNHTVDKKVSRECKVGDLLSIRKHGRFKIVENKKKTKGGKIVLVVKKSV